MKKSQLRKIIRESIKQLMTESTNCYDEDHHMACTDSVCSPSHQDYNSINPFCEAGYGSYWQEEGPAWEKAAQDWINWAGVQCDESSYPIPSNFKSSIDALGCGGKQKRKIILDAKLFNYQSGGLPVPGNPRWQSLLLAKTTYLFCVVNRDC